MIAPVSLSLGSRQTVDLMTDDLYPNPIPRIAPRADLLYAAEVFVSCATAGNLLVSAKSANKQDPENFGQIIASSVGAGQPLATWSNDSTPVSPWPKDANGLYIYDMSDTAIYPVPAGMTVVFILSTRPTVTARITVELRP